jgi:hypothetical protein
MIEDGTTAGYVESNRLKTAARYPIWVDYIKNLKLGNERDENNNTTEEE